MDIFIYAAIALFVAYRLYAVLGQRNDSENTRPNPFAGKPEQDAAKNPATKEDLLPLASNLLGPPPPPKTPFAMPEPAPDSLAGGLLAIRKADMNFDEKTFLKGARLAFEIIVHAFIAAERGALKNLLAPPLYQSFDRAITERENARERWEVKVLNLRDAEIVAARLEGREAVITVQFHSDQSKKIYDGDGQLIRDPGRDVERITDRWTFRRDTTSPNPNWLLVEADSA